MTVRRLLGIPALCLLLLPACAPQGETGENGSHELVPSYEGIPADGPPTPGGVVRRNLTSEPELVNPALSTGLSAAYIEEEVFDHIVMYDQTLTLRGRLAESWERSEDNLVYTFKLRKGLKWHDGEPLTAHDVKFTMDMIREPANRAIAQLSEFEALDRLEVVDDLTFRAHYKQAFAPAIDTWTLQPIPKHVFEDYYKEHGEIRSSPRNRENVIGSGAYRLADWQPQTALVLEAFDDYWDGRPPIDKHIIKLMKTISVQFQALKSGEIDMGTMTPEMYVYEVDDAMRERFNFLQYYMWAYSYIGWNGDGSNPFFNDVKVRRAMTMLTDRQRMIDKMMLGFGEVVSGPLHFNHWAYPKDVEPLPHNPDLAKQLLMEAGWSDTNGDGWLDKNGHEFRFEIMVGAGSETFQRQAEFLQQEYRAAGIDMQIRNLEWAAFIQKVRDHDFQACMLTWVATPHPDTMRNIWHSSMYDGGRNYVGFNDPEVDRLLEEGMLTFDREKQTGIYSEVHRRIHEAQPYTFLSSTPSTVAVHKRLRNIKPSPRGIYLYAPGCKQWYIPKELQGTAGK